MMQKPSNYTKMVLKILRMNATIIKDKIAKNHTIVDLLDLKILGFNLSFFTYRYVKEDGIEVFFCFEYGYYFTKDKKIALVFLNELEVIE
ncbi:MAG: hypothetical protein EOO99_01810 [Pedobacter sp.]|nr:MAG: hypothetical protein EOO99_01810 [Pedobacter sp.]